jgi:hypothetical protein
MKLQNARKKQKPEAMASKGKVATGIRKRQFLRVLFRALLATCGTPSTASAFNPLSSSYSFSRPIETAFGAQANQIPNQISNKIQKFLMPLLQRPLRANPRAPNSVRGRELRLPIPHRNCSTPEQESCPLDALQAPFGCDADDATCSESLSSLQRALYAIGAPRTLRIPVHTRSNVSLHFHWCSCIGLASFDCLPAP